MSPDDTAVGETYYSAPSGSSSKGTNMSSKKSVRTVIMRQDIPAGCSGTGVDRRWMPEGVELLILAMTTSPLKGRNTTIRNSTAKD